MSQQRRHPQRHVEGQRAMMYEGKDDKREAKRRARSMTRMLVTRLTREHR